MIWLYLKWDKTSFKKRVVTNFVRQYEKRSALRALQDRTRPVPPRVQGTRRQVAAAECRAVSSRVAPAASTKRARTTYTGKTCAKYPRTMSSVMAQFQF